MGDVPYSYLLESVEGGERQARYSFLGGAPSLIFKSKGRRVTLISRDKKEKTFDTARDPLFELEKLLKRYRQAPVKDLPPFSGGAVGYMGYDVVRFIEKIPDKNKDVLGIPDALFIFTDTLFVFDHLNKKIKVISNVFLDDFKNAGEAYDHAVAKIDQEISRLRSMTGQKRVSAKEPAGQEPVVFKSNFREKEFEKAVLAAKEYIKKGDIIQAVLSQSFSTPVHSSAFDIYRALRSINPSPYMFYLNCGDFQLCPTSEISAERG